MVLVGSYVNLDFDDKVKFKEKFGNDELSKFIRKAIKEKLEEKNREACINLSAVSTESQKSSVITVTQVNESLEKWLTNIDTVDDLGQLAMMEGKGLQMVQICKKRYKKVKWGI